MLTLSLTVDQAGPGYPQKSLYLGEEISRMNQHYPQGSPVQQSTYELPEAMACKSGFGSQSSSLGKHIANMKDKAGDWKAEGIK